MGGTILVRSEGSGNAKLLERKVFELSDEFSKEGVKLIGELRESLEFGGVEVGLIVLTISGWIAIPLISKLVDKLFDKDEDVKNVKIQINIKESNITLNLPEDKQKLLDYYKKKNE